MDAGEGVREITAFFRTSEKRSYDYASSSLGSCRRARNHITDKWEPGQVSVTVAIPAGTYDSLAGLTYPQISREGLGFREIAESADRMCLRLLPRRAAIIASARTSLPRTRKKASSMESTSRLPVLLIWQVPRRQNF